MKIIFNSVVFFRFILQPPTEIKKQLDNKMKASEEKIESLQVCFKF
jgi:hypothetical protein